MITGAQMRAARAMARWTPRDLAGRAKLTVEAIRRAERFNRIGALTIEHEQAIRSALRAAGVEFTNAGGPGVRLEPHGPADEGLRPQELTCENYG